MDAFQLAGRFPYLQLNFIIIVHLLKILLQIDFTSLQGFVEQDHTIALAEGGLEIVDIADERFVAVKHTTKLVEELGTLGGEGLLRGNGLQFGCFDSPLLAPKRQR